MDNRAKDASLIDRSVYTLVLTKLKHILVNGFYQTDEVRYLYSWNDQKSKSQNLRAVMKEDAALKYFLDIGVARGMRIENEFRRQELSARAIDPGNRVWAIWNDVDSAYREYEWVVLLYGIDVDKFEKELTKFALVDTGMELVELIEESKVSPVKAKFGPFTAHRDGSITYLNKLVDMKPGVKRLVHALITKKGVALSYEQIVDVLWNAKDNSQKYLEATRTSRQIQKRISNIVSEANNALSKHADKKHLVPSGETSYKMIL